MSARIISKGLTNRRRFLALLGALIAAPKEMISSPQMVSVSLKLDGREIARRLSQIYERGRLDPNEIREREDRSPIDDHGGPL